ncbi:hypothetical protein D3C72_1669420 [compost metagenome]
MVELRAAGLQLCLQVIENRFWQPAGVVVGLHHQRRYGADDGGLRHSVFAVASNVVDDFPTAGGVSYMDSTSYAKMVDYGRNVIGIVIHVVPVPDLTGSPVAASVMCNDPVAVGQEKEHLRIPVVRTEWPTVMKEDHSGIARPPVFVKDLNTVLRSDIPHVRISCMKWRP